MTEEYKAWMRQFKVNLPHIDEFGDCVGTVEGPVDYGVQKGPELNVRWQPSNLRYGYHPDHLEEV